MTTRAKKPAKKAAPKKRKKAEAPAPAMDPTAPRPVRDLNDTRGPNAPVLGHFVDVVDGEHAGAYGVWVSTPDNGKTAVVRTRDNNTDLFTVSVSDLRPAQAGRR